MSVPGGAERRRAGASGGRSVTVTAGGERPPTCDDSTEEENVQPTTDAPEHRPGTAPSGRGTAAAAAVLALGAALALAGPAAAQEAPSCEFRSPASELDERASPPDSSSVELGGGVVKVCYSSPRVRGREIFGGLVPHGSPWRLGANEPTTLHTTTALSIGGVEVEPGSYSLYAVPGMEEWEVVVNGSTDRWGIPINEQVTEHDVGTVTASPEMLDETMESMTIRLEPADEGSATMAISWAMTRVEIALDATGATEEGY